MVEGKRREDVAVDGGGFLHLVVGCGGGNAEALGEGQADGFGYGDGVGFGQTHPAESALHGADDALTGVGQGAVEIEEYVFVLHAPLTWEWLCYCLAVWVLFIQYKWRCCVIYR